MFRVALLASRRAASGARPAVRVVTLSCRASPRGTVGAAPAARRRVTAHARRARPVYKRPGGRARGSRGSRP